MKHVFVFDPKSFHEQQWKMDSILDHIGQFFRTQDKPDFSIQISRYRRDAIGLIQKEVESAVEDDTVRVYAIGGEEILYDCLNGIAELPNTELAAVPYGETSDFLRNFGEGKEDLFRDIPSLVQAGTVSTDMIDLGSSFALNSCLIGLKAASTIKIKSSKEMFFLFSKISYFFNYLSFLFDRQITSQYYNITIDERDFSGNYSLINIANGPWYTGKITGLSAAMPNDGLLDVALIKSAGPFKTLLSMKSYSKGIIPSNCVNLQAKKITVQSDRYMSIQLDNEFYQDTSISLNVLPQALQLVAVNDLSYQKL